MDIIAVHQAVKHAREWALADNGPLLLEFVTYRYGGHSMSDPGTTYRTREEVQRMRSTQDPIKGLQKYIEEWGIATEEQLKEIDKKAKQEVDAAVEEAKKSAEPDLKDLWTDIYYAGTEPEFMRGREREEVCHDRALSSSANDFWSRFITTSSYSGNRTYIYSLVSVAIIERFYRNERGQSEEER
jgi:pyruvate dehydrogenase E1 component alpha subunit